MKCKYDENLKLLRLLIETNSNYNKYFNKKNVCIEKYMVPKLHTKDNQKYLSVCLYSPEGFFKTEIGGKTYLSKIEKYLINISWGENYEPLILNSYNKGIKSINDMVFDLNENGFKSALDVAVEEARSFS